MAITYDAPSDTITVTGYTAGTPCTFLDVYNADVAGSWGQVTKQCNNQFCFNCLLVIGDASTATYFVDIEKHIIFTNVASNIKHIRVRSNAHFRIGEVINAGRRTSKKGCSIICLTQSSSSYLLGGYGSGDDGEIEVYSSTLQHLGTVKECDIFWYSTNYKIWNSILININQWMAWVGAPCEVYNIQVTNALEIGYFLYPKTINVFDKVSVFESNSILASGTAAEADFTVKNLYARGCTYVFYTWAAWTKTGNFVNVDTDLWAFFWTAGTTGTVYRQYEFDLKVIDKDNVAINAATVKIWDKDSNLVVDTTTNASGVIATQTITRGYYNQANGNTLQEASPHLIKIEKAGYTTYEADFTLEDKTDWLIALQVGGGGLLRNPPMTGGMV